MFYNPHAQSPFEEYVAAWLARTDLVDPIQKFLEFHRAEATYLRSEHGDNTRAHAIERMIGRLEKLFEAIRETSISYKDAEKVSVWKHGTIRNKSSDNTIETEGGKVRVAQLAIGPDTPGLQALRFVDKVEAHRREAGRAVADTRAGDTEIKARVTKAKAKARASAPRRPAA